MKRLTFWFSSDTNTSHFIDFCEQRGIGFSTERVPFLHVEVEPDQEEALRDAAIELGGEVGEKV
jgi:hypothetical protein